MQKSTVRRLFYTVNHGFIDICGPFRRIQSTSNKRPSSRDTRQAAGLCVVGLRYGTHMPPFSPRSLLASLTLHIAVVLLFTVAGGLGWLAWTWHATDSRSAAVMSPVGVDHNFQSAQRSSPSAAAVAPPMSPAVSPEMVRQHLVGKVAQAREQSFDDQLAAVRRSDAQLAAMPADHVQSIVSLVETGVGVDSAATRAWTPDPAATGAFEAASAVPYDIETIVSDDGSRVQRWRLVDAAGRELIVARPLSELTGSEQATAASFQMARDNPNLQSLIRSVYRMAETPTAHEPRP